MKAAPKFCHPPSLPWWLLMKAAKPIKHCMMMITDAKGKAYMIDTSTKKAQAECEKMAM